MAESVPSRADDFIDIYVAPAAVFERRIDGKFGLPLLVLFLAMAVLFFLGRSAMEPIMDAEFTRAMAGRQNLTPEQLEQGRQMAGTFGTITAILVIPIMALLLGIGVWLGGRAAGAKLSYAQSATIGTFALFPKLVDSVVAAVQALLMDEANLNSRFSVSLGVGRFLDPDTTNAGLLAFAGRIDLFTLWVTLLVAIGIKTMGRTSTGSAALGAVVVWLLGSLPTVLPGLMR
jgi:hypothetical protein